MSSNIPILYQNVLSSFATEFERDVFLWATDKFPEDRCAYKAEAFAREAGRVRQFTADLIGMARKQHPEMSDEQADDLLQFISIRHANYRLGGNIKEMTNGDAA